jgi:hypothetical protein
MVAKGMKKAYKLVLALLASIAISCIAKYSGNSDSPEEFILNFYTEYHKIWALPNNENKRQLLDSVLEAHCTPELLLKVKEPNLDHDMIINDHYTTVEYLNTITVVKKPNTANCFLVNYMAPSENPMGEPLLIEIVISLCLVNSENSYKISIIELP